MDGTRFAAELWTWTVTQSLANIKGVLDRLPGSNEAELHATRVGPRVERTAAEFGAVIHRQRVRQADGFRESVQDANDAQPRQRPIDFDRDAFPREVVDAAGPADRPHDRRRRRL